MIVHASKLTLTEPTDFKWAALNSHSKLAC